MKLTKHSKLRMKERTGLNHNERKSLFRRALDNGKSINDIKDDRTREYLLKKKNCKVKLYRGYVFLYSKNSKTLYTMYKLPDGIEKEGVV